MKLELLDSLFVDWEVQKFKNLESFELREWSQSKGIIFFDELASTQKFVQGMDKASLFDLEEMLVLTPRQTKGHGRLDRSWYANPLSSLTFNYISSLPSGILPGHLSLLTAWAQWKVFTGLYGIADVDLKWPNDVLIQSKKCSGSLMELISYKGVQKLSLGLGVNVGKIDFPEELKGLSISLADVMKDSLDRVQILHDVVMCFREGLKILNDPSWLLTDYTSASSFVKGAELEFMEGEVLKRGLSAGLSSSGGLMILNEQGQKKEWHGSEIQKVRKG